MTEYHVALTMERPLDEKEVQNLVGQRSGSSTNYEMNGNNVVLVHLDAADSLAARETAEHQVLLATGVKIQSAQLIP